MASNTSYDMAGTTLTFVGQDTAGLQHIAESELQDFWEDLAADLVRDEQVTN
jgi:hypothetical protein